jgi:hypothetical protein
MSDTEYMLDADDHIRSVGGAWRAFAHENGAPELVGAVLGTSIWRWIEGPEVRHLYEILFSSVRGTGGHVRFPLRCDSPRLRRFMELELAALSDGGLRFRAVLHRVEPREPVGLPAGRDDGPGPRLVICSWCNHVRVDVGRWLEIEDALRALRLLEAPPHAITHTICPGCEARFDRLLDVGVRRRDGGSE